MVSIYGSKNIYISSSIKWQMKNIFVSQLVTKWQQLYRVTSHEALGLRIIKEVIAHGKIRLD